MLVVEMLQIAEIMLIMSKYRLKFRDYEHIMESISINKHRVRTHKLKSLEYCDKENLEPFLKILDNINAEELFQYKDYTTLNSITIQLAI